MVLFHRYCHCFSDCDHRKDSLRSYRSKASQPSQEVFPLPKVSYCSGTSPDSSEEFVTNWMKMFSHLVIVNKKMNYLRTISRMRVRVTVMLVYSASSSTAFDRTDMIFLKFHDRVFTWRTTVSSRIDPLFRELSSFSTVYLCMVETS